MSARLPSHLQVAAMIRSVNNAGGSAMVLARGDADAGGILVVASNKASSFNVLERGITSAGVVGLIASMGGPTDDTRLVTDYWQRRRARDPDLWVIELDIADAERFAAETIAAG